MAGYRIVRTDDEVERVREWVAEGLAKGTHHRGMTYEDGIDDVLRWLFGETEAPPDDDGED